MAKAISTQAIQSSVDSELLHVDSGASEDAILVSDLSSYLSSQGIGDADLTRVASLLEAMQGEDLLRGVQGDQEEAETASTQQPETDSPTDTVRIYLAEEQQILREAYGASFEAEPTIQAVGTSRDTSDEALVAAAIELKPQVMILGVKTLQADTVETLEKIRDAHSESAIVLLFAFYDAQGIKALRDFSRETKVGCAYLLKHTIDTSEQLTQMIQSVAQGRVIVDPMVMDELIKTGDKNSGALGDLSPKALEVLSWVARGYRNDSIAQMLSRDVKTVERHINNIYGAIQDVDGTGDDSRHPRVQAALAYLRATGALSSEQLL